VISLISGKFAPLKISETIGVGNITHNNDADIKKAAKQAGANAFIENLPLGYDTHLRNDNKRSQGSSRYSSNRSKRKPNCVRSISSPQEKEKTCNTAMPVDLSGGQWQRIALSRSFMRSSSADLLILDEPSSSLDPEAEAGLFTYLQEIGWSKTMIYVTHRFYTARMATKIALLDNGRLTEWGSHDELMNLPSGKYAKLYQLQSRGFK
jgi:ABC-type multidrug transport system fused ATPase/permease subunit